VRLDERFFYALGFSSEKQRCLFISRSIKHILIKNAIHMEKTSAF